MENPVSEVSSTTTDGCPGPLGELSASGSLATQSPSREELLAFVRSQSGTAPIKAEFIDFTKVYEKFNRGKDALDNSHGQVSERRDKPTTNNSNEPPPKKQRVRGQNKHRPRDKRTLPNERPCLDTLKGKTCSYGNKCKYSHDIVKMMSSKPPDIGPRCYLFDNFGRCPYGLMCRYGKMHINKNFQNIVDDEKVRESGGMPAVINNLSRDLQFQLRKKKYDFKKYDQYMKSLKAKRSHKEQLASNNSTETEKSTVSSSKTGGGKTSGQISSDNLAIAKETLSSKVGQMSEHQNDIQNDMEAITSESSDVTVNPVTSSSETSCQSQTDDKTTTSVDSTSNDDANNCPSADQDVAVQRTRVVLLESKSTSSPSQPSPSAARAIPMVMDDGDHHAGVVTDADVIKLRPTEKKKLDVEDKLLLAPLTTVGNLPFRRICKQYGADITCGEMAMCTNLLQGQTSEWALLKRHPSEDVFGVQLCGGFPDTMTKCAELLNGNIDIDFVDINVGCPIDLVYHKGAGCGLINRLGKFQEIVRGMSSVLDIPLTVKMRTGIQEGRLNAHKLIPRIYDWGASVVTVHGRTRVQRYTKVADWNYLAECAQAARPHPFIGNGDVLSFEDANYYREESGVSSLMIARGALIKPWVFTEIKEQRHWDISSGERLDILQDYVNAGLMHWGSDSEGVEKTRRFLLEWLSFLHRYIPVGLLERLPQHINERPPYFVGRDDMETMMSSANCRDWIKISEMLLGPVPEDFQFLPKHKANSYK